VVDHAVVAPEDFAAGPDEDRVRERAGRSRVKGGDKGVLVGAGEEVVVGLRPSLVTEGLGAFGETGALFLEEGLGFGFVFRDVEADGHELEITAVELAGERDERGEFFDAGAHEVAETLMRRTLAVALARREATPAASIFSMVTGILVQAASAFMLAAFSRATWWSSRGFS